MDSEYLGFFKRASDIYNSAGGHGTLLAAIDSGRLRDGLDGKRYDIAKATLLDFFEGKNTKGNNRMFGIGPYELQELIRMAEDKELNSPRQST